MRIKTTITHPGDQKSNGDVRTGNFPDIDQHLQILDEYFSTFLTLEQVVARCESVDNFDTRFQRCRILVRILEGIREFPGIPKIFYFRDFQVIPKILMRFLRFLSDSMRFQMNK